MQYFHGQYFSFLVEKTTFLVSLPGNETPVHFSAQSQGPTMGPRPIPKPISLKGNGISKCESSKFFGKEEGHG
jgi:hypothetical protein